NLPHTFKSNATTHEWKVLFRTVRGQHCIAAEDNADRKSVVQGKRTLPETPVNQEHTVTLTGTQGTWSFQCCNHPEMTCEISVEPEPDLIVEMTREGGNQFLNLPHTFKSNATTHEWKVLFRTVRGQHCIAAEDN